MGKQTVGQYLKNKRLQKGYTLNHACLLSGVSYSTLGHWESDSVSEIRIDSLNKLISLYNIKASELTSETKCRVDINRIVIEV